MTQVKVKDFGPISQASVEIKPLTVFVGPNNSGKSYLALAIYCLSRTLSSGSPFDGTWLPHMDWPYRKGLPRKLLQQTSTALKSAFPEFQSLPHNPIKASEMPYALQESIIQANMAFGDVISVDYGNEMERCYGTTIRSLVRRGTALQAAQMEVGLVHKTSGFTWEMQATGQKMAATSWETNILETEIAVGRDDFPFNRMAEDPESFLATIVRDLSFPRLGQLMMRAHYMPASRSGILLGHKTLAGLIVRQASRAWLEPIEIPRLPGVITDLIQAILLLDDLIPTSGQMDDVISFLEGNVARGTIDVEPAPEYQEVYYENESGKFRLHQVSSMVSEVAPIVLFLKYLVRPGHLFIVEEPESHIDAENQRKLAQAIAMLVNAGVKVLVTTHSDYFVNQINNLLLLSQLTPRKRAARKYSASEVLNPDDVGAYFFEPSDEGSVVRALEVTAEEGISTLPFTDVHSALYSEAIALEHAST